MCVQVRALFPNCSLHASLFYKSLHFTLAFTLKLYNYVASFPQPTVVTFTSLTCTRSSPHTHTLTHSPHVVLRQRLLDWATKRLVASFPLVPLHSVPRPKGLWSSFTNRILLYFKICIYINICIFSHITNKKIFFYYTLIIINYFQIVPFHLYLLKIKYLNTVRITFFLNHLN